MVEQSNYRLSEENLDLLAFGIMRGTIQLETIEREMGDCLAEDQVEELRSLARKHRARIEEET